MKERIVFILGPTASGKSDAAAEFAERTGGEIISCDSMQVYRDMDIITRAPGKELERKAPHHLVRIMPPEEEYSAACFAEKASRAIRDIILRGKVPVFAGGSGLYVKALLDGLFPSPPKDEALRGRLTEMAVSRGAGYLHDRLKEIDPEAAGSIDPGNIRRVVRAMEVFELTGRRFSDKKAETKGIEGEYDTRLFGLDVPRPDLYGRINERVDRMFEEGLVDEVRRIAVRKISITAGKALGIKEVKAYLSGDMSLDTAREELKRNTRRYAKRQLTWFKADKRIVWLSAWGSLENYVY